MVEGVECVVSRTTRPCAAAPSTPGRWPSRRAADIALENRLPLVNLVESGGADLPTQSEIFIPGGAVFRDLTQRSAAGIPTIALVFGNSTAGGAYVPGMSDYVVMVEERAKVFLGGPPLVKMATGEESDDEELGGAEMHARYAAWRTTSPPTRHDAIRIGRRIVRPAQLAQAGPRAAAARDRPVRPRRAARHRADGPRDALRPARRARPGRRRIASSTSSSRSTARAS